MDLTDAVLADYMGRAIELAKQRPWGIGRPYVGALVVSPSGEGVGEGYKHFLDGTDIVVHAERMALDNADESAVDGCLITTLEPCALAHKKQVFSPCAELITKRGIHMVVLGLIDETPSFGRRAGINYLQRHGIDVVIYSGFN